MLNTYNDINNEMIISILLFGIGVYIIYLFIININIEVNLDDINTKFKKNQKLNNIKYNKIEVIDDKVKITKKKVINYINKYLEKQYNTEYNLKYISISNILMEYNNDKKLYRISYILELDKIKIDVIIYLDSNNNIFISTINKYEDIDINEDDIDILYLLTNPDKLYNIYYKLKVMKDRGYSAILVDPNNTAVSYKFEDNNLNNDNINNDNINNNYSNNNNYIGGTGETFYNGDKKCDGCFKTDKIVNCDIEQDIYSNYAAF